jgi:hypothetical protein
MKRFIDLRGQVFNDDDLPIEQQEPLFAFFCTVTDTFTQLNGVQTWGTASELRTDYELQVGKLDADFERLWGLLPNWVLAVEPSDPAATE